MSVAVVELGKKLIAVHLGRVEAPGVCRDVTQEVTGQHFPGLLRPVHHQLQCSRIAHQITSVMLQKQALEIIKCDGVLLCMVRLEVSLNPDKQAWFQVPCTASANVPLQMSTIFEEVEHNWPPPQLCTDRPRLWRQARDPRTCVWSMPGMLVMEWYEKKSIGSPLSAAARRVSSLFAALETLDSGPPDWPPPCPQT